MTGGRDDRDPEDLLREIVLTAMNNPAQLADLLASIGCPADSLRGRVMADLAYTFGGWIQDAVDQPEDAAPLACTCERPIPAEVKAMRVVFAYNAIDGTSDAGETLREALMDAVRCPACNLDVHAAAARFQVNLLNNTQRAWLPDNKIGDLEKHYLSILDKIEQR